MLIWAISMAAGNTLLAEDCGPATGEIRPMFIREYRVRGAKQVDSGEIGEAVYPYLGPGRMPADVDKARAAVEKLYRDKGYQAVSVQIPVQTVKRGVVVLEVSENRVGRLRVKGGSFTLPSAVKEEAPSMAEGQVLDFAKVTKDLVALNQSPDRQVKAVPRLGEEPGTLDVDLVVEDSLPLHGSLELNNRYSADTTQTRLNGAISYGNLWQLGHALGLNFQIAPENLDDAQVYSGYYLAPIPSSDGLSVMLQGTWQDSDVSTLGGTAAAGRGEILGMRLLKALPPGKDFAQSLSVGLDYKHFDENVKSGLVLIRTAPVTYYPFSALYSASWKQGENRTDFNGGVTLNLRGLGSSAEDFDGKRYNSDGSFLYFRGDVSHTHELPGKFQAFGRIQGQASDQPLVNSEQFAGGGLGTARGYLESEVLGDDALFGTLELRSPSLVGDGSPDGDEWRVYGFVDGGQVYLHDALPGQKASGSLLSAGLGTRGRFLKHFNTSLDAGIPLLKRDSHEPRSPMCTYRLWGDF